MAKDQVKKIKKERNIEYSRQMLGIFVSTLLAVMITYFVYNIRLGMSNSDTTNNKANEGVKTEV